MVLAARCGRRTRIIELHGPLLMPKFWSQGAVRVREFRNPTLHDHAGFPVKKSGPASTRRHDHSVNRHRIPASGWTLLMHRCELVAVGRGPPHIMPRGWGNGPA
jgi:hypothetical protein